MTGKQHFFFFLVKGQMVNILGFVGHKVSVTVTQFCLCSESSHKEYANKWMWLCYCKNFIHKTGGGLDLAKFVPLLEPPHMKSQLIGKDPDTDKDWGQEEKEVGEHEMVRWHHWVDGHECEQTLGDSDGQESLACCSPWGHKESDMTEQLNNKFAGPSSELLESEIRSNRNCPRIP